MEEGLVDIQLQQERIKNNVELMQQAIIAILSSSHNTDVRTKIKINEIDVDFRQQLNAVQNSIPLSNLNLHSLTDSIGVENKVSHFIPGQGQGDKQNFHHETIKDEKILNTSIHIDRQKKKESKNNLSSFLSETNFSKEDLMDVFAKAIAGATTSSTSATTSSTSATTSSTSATTSSTSATTSSTSATTSSTSATTSSTPATTSSTSATTSYARGSAPITLTKVVKIGKTSLQISGDPNDHSHASLNVLNGSSNFLSRTVLSDDSDSDSDNNYDERLSENPTTRTTRTTTTTIEKNNNNLPESYQNQNPRPLIPQRDYHRDLGSSVAADESSNRNIVVKFDTQDEIIFHEKFNKQKILHVRQASIKEEVLESNNSPKRSIDQSERKSQTQRSYKSYDPTTSTSSATTAAEELKLFGRRSIPFNGGTVKWTDESEYQSRQSYPPPPADKGNLHQNHTWREMHFLGKTEKGGLKEYEEEGDVGLYHNTANDNANALQAARESSGVYGPYGYKDSALRRTEGSMFPNTSILLSALTSCQVLY